MRIIEEGEKRTFTTECFGCRTKFEYTTSDCTREIEKNDTYNIVKDIVKCPCCSNKTVVHEFMKIE